MAYTKFKSARKGSRYGNRKFNGGGTKFKRGRVAPKGGGKGALSSRASVARLAREVAHLKRGTKQEHTVMSYDLETSFYAGAESSSKVRGQYFFVPVTRALPPMDMRAGGAFEGYRKKRLVTVTGVQLSFQVGYRTEFALHAMLHYNAGGFLAEVERLQDGTPNMFMAGVKTGSDPPALLDLGQTGLVMGRDGPYKTNSHRVEGSEGVETVFELASGDGTLLDCPVRPGASVGKVDFSLGTRGEAGYSKVRGCKAVNVVVPGPSGPMGEALWPMKRFKAFWKLDEPVEFTVEEGFDNPVLAKYMQIVVMVKSMVGSMSDKEMQADVAGFIRGARVKVFYNSGGLS
jgi:hypothetical protein